MRRPDPLETLAEELADGLEAQGLPVDREALRRLLPPIIARNKRQLRRWRWVGLVRRLVGLP